MDAALGILKERADSSLLKNSKRMFCTDLLPPLMAQTSESPGLTLERSQPGEGQG
jgi:hypothetical protein